MEPKREQSLTDPCPMITVNGREYCLNETCRVRGIVGVKCPPAMPQDELPDLLVGWDPQSFRAARKQGVWNKQ